MRSLIVFFTIHLTSPLFAQGNSNAAGDKIVSMRGLGNAHAADFVIMSVMNADVAYQVYQAIFKLNQQANSNTTLLLVGPQTVGGARNELYQALHDRIGKNLQTGSDQTVPYVQYVEVPGLNAYSDPWVQDAIQLAVIKTKNRQQMVLLDNRRGLDHADVASALAKHLKMTVVPVGSNLAHDGGSGDDGGNIEVTPDGKFYVGEGASPELIRDLKLFTRSEIAVIPHVNKFAVPHVDVNSTFFNGRNGTSLLVADPLTALDIIRKTRSTPVPPMLASFGLGVEEIRESLAFFLRGAKKLPKDLVLADFDLSKIPREGHVEDHFVWQQLQIKLLIDEQIKALPLDKSSPIDIVPVPQIFNRTRDGYIYNLFANTANAMVINQGLLVAKMGWRPFDDYIRTQLKKRMSSEHFFMIDTSAFAGKGGELNCMSCVIRSSRRVLIFEGGSPKIVRAEPPCKELQGVFR
jgi:hypothetical protein